MIEQTPNNSPWIITALVTVIGAVGLFAEKIGFSNFLTKKAGANKDCQQRIKKLEFVIVKLVSVIKTTSAFMSNPENAEQSKRNIEQAMLDISDIIEQIEQNNLVEDGK